MAYNYDKFDKSITEFVKENNIQSIAFPILGAGHFGYPLDIAIDCALNSFKQIYDNSISIKLVCYTEEEYTIAKKLII